MISFYPGPSKLYPRIGQYMQEAIKEGVLSINHRSPEFVAISEKTIKLLKQKLSIPKDYWIFFTSSATESWEIIAQSLIKDKSTHLYSGAFGEKWFEYTKNIKPRAQGIAFEFNKEPEVTSYNGELIGVVQNETSNGSQVSNKILKKLKEANPNSLIAIDATSSLGGIKIDFKNADVCLASVQKCFGLPAGLGLLICSPNAIEKAIQLNESAHYNSLTFMIEKMKVGQTTTTPNVLGIYLLMKSLSDTPSITETGKIIQQRAKDWYSFIQTLKQVQLLVDRTSTRSDTVIAIKGEENLIAQLKKEAKQEGILLGNGYGKWAKNTFRIANFPSLTEMEIKKLKKLLAKRLK